MDLPAFLVAAKRATYAAQGDEASVTPLIPGTRQLEFADGDWTYRDVYVGGRRFAGQEIVSRAGAVEWSMAYAGGVADEVGEADVAPIYAFLREALRQVPSDRPYRGPERFERDGWRYVNEVDGSIDALTGRELIERDGTLVYELTYAGGRIR